MDYLPVLIIAYARIENVLKLVTQIAGRLSNKIYLSIDGPRNSQVSKVQELMVSKAQAISERQGARLYIWHRKINLGVGASVPCSVDWFLAKEHSGIIIEDDLEVEDDFFYFAQKNIALVEHSSQLVMLSGSRFLPPATPVAAIFSNYPMIWGWATTKEGWSKLRSAYFEPLNFPTLLPNSSVRGYWSVGSYRARVGLIDTWDLPLVEKMIKERWFCLIPPANLITNNGVDSHASHTKKQEFPIGYSRQKLTETYELDLLNMAKIANRYDTFLNKSIYKIRFKHFFSPIKLWLMRRNFNENLQSSLAYRIQTNELPKD